MAGHGKRKVPNASQPRKTKEEWDIVKPDISRIYMQESKSLKVTMAAIEEEHQFKQRYTANPAKKYQILIWPC